MTNIYDGNRADEKRISMISHPVNDSLSSSDSDALTSNHTSAASFANVNNSTLSSCSVNGNSKKIAFTIGKKRKINDKITPANLEQFSKRPNAMVDEFQNEQPVTMSNSNANLYLRSSPTGSTSSEGGGGGSGFSSGDNDSVGSSEDERRLDEQQTSMNADHDNPSSVDNVLNSGEGRGSTTLSEEVAVQHQPQHESSSSSVHVNNPLLSTTTDTTLTHCNNHLIHQHQIQSSLSPTNTQPDGWRVKLYRLNADGSWDDCGTGRIICYTSDASSTNTVRSRSPFPLSTQGKENDKQLKSSDEMPSSLSLYRNWAEAEEEIYKSLGEPTLCMYGEIPVNSQLQHLVVFNEKTHKVLLRTRVLLRESYQRQGDNIITWCEPYFSPAKDDSQQQENKQLSNGRMEEEENGVDLALSFQDNAGCRDIWNQISKIQHKAHEMFERSRAYQTYVGDSRYSAHSSNGDNESKTSNQGLHGDTSDGASMSRRENLSSPDNHSDKINHKATHVHISSVGDTFTHNIWTNADASRNAVKIDGIDVDQQNFIEAEATANSIAAHYGGNRQVGVHNKNQMLHSSDSIDQGHVYTTAQLPSPPNLNNLEEIADIIAASQPQQRDSISMFVSRAECSYLKQLLTIFPSAEAMNDYHALATLASIIKSILLFNEPSIIQLVASDEKVFEDCCCCLEYDPDLREKANHRWFIRDRLRFRTVIEIEDDDLVESIHKSFRVTFIRDTLLRPTMDESSLSTLSSLLTFTHADIVKGVMCAPRNENAKSQDSYLVQIIRMLGKEIMAIREIEWESMERKGRPPKPSKSHLKGSTPTNSVSGNIQSSFTAWTQHLAPQDNSLLSRRIRRSGCLSFLKEMFNIVRTSLQQSDKDDFYAMIVLMDVKISEGNNEDTETKKMSETTVNLLSLLGDVLADVNSDMSERGACLEILSAIAMHDPSHIRKHCLDEFAISKSENEKNHKQDHIISRPEPNDDRQVIFACPPNDLCLSLLFVMATENDAGIMIQTCEVLRIVLDTEMVNDPGQIDLGGVIDNEEDELIGSDNLSFLVENNPHNGHGGGGCEKNSFLNMFYDHYVQWLVAPFQFFILIPKTAISYTLKKQAEAPDNSMLQLLLDKHRHLKDAKISRSGIFKTISTCSVRLTFSVELLSFCVRAHFFRMKRYLINSRVLIHVMKMLSPRSKTILPSGDRCLKLGALRCLRTILSLKDDFYNRHIIQHKLFTPVFEAFRANPVGDNLVSSSIIEICEFIRTENNRSLIEYIVTKHLSEGQALSNSRDVDFKHLPSLEDVATPYVDTLTQLRQKYEENIKKDDSTDSFSDGGDRRRRTALNEKAIEDQRKFRETDEEESYFFDDGEDNHESMVSNQDYGNFQG